MTPREIKMGRAFYAAFKGNNSTAQIARLHRVPEDYVYNTLHRFREAQRKLPFDSPLRNQGAEQ